MGYNPVINQLANPMAHLSTVDGYEIHELNGGSWRFIGWEIHL